MGRKDFQKGMEAGAKPFEEKFKQQADAINRVSDRIESGINKIDGVVEVVIDELSSIQKKELYDLNTQFDIKKMEDFEKELLLACLYTLAGDNANENQQAYIRSVQKYLNIKNPQTKIDLSGIENIETIASQKAIYQTISELLFLQKENNSFYNEYSDFFEYFSVNRKDRDVLYENIIQIHKAAGAQGLCEKYGYVPSKKTRDASLGNIELEKLEVKEAITVKEGEEIIFSEKEVYLYADINCEGFISFDQCIIIYGGKINGLIKLNEKGSVKMTYCSVISRGRGSSRFITNTNNEDDSIDRNHNVNKDILYPVFTAENTYFYNCNDFINNVQVHLSDCVIKSRTDLLFSAAIHGKNNSVMNQCFIEYTGEKHEKQDKNNSKGMFSVLGSTLNTIAGDASTGGFLLSDIKTFRNCTFKNVSRCIKNTNEIINCSFIQCSVIFCGYEQKKEKSPSADLIIESSNFIKCEDVFGDNTKTKKETGILSKIVGDGVLDISNSQFIDCSNTLFKNEGREIQIDNGYIKAKNNWISSKNNEQESKTEKGESIGIDEEEMDAGFPGLSFDRIRLYTIPD